MKMKMTMTGTRGWTMLTKVKTTKDMEKNQDRERTGKEQKQILFVKVERKPLRLSVPKYPRPCNDCPPNQRKDEDCFI